MNDDHNCSGFKSLRGNTDLNGYSIIFNSDNPSAPYKLVMRSIDKKSEGEFANVIKNRIPFNVKVSGEIAIKFCPWCGAKLGTGD